MKPVAEDEPGRANDAGELDGAVAVVTGSTSGIGLATVDALARRGAHIACVHVPGADTNELDSKPPVRGHRMKLAADLADPSSVRDVVPQVLSAFQRIDILVNAAGVFDYSPFLDQSLDNWERVIAVNLTAPFLLIQAAGAVMAGQGGGRIVNIGSSSAFRAEDAPPAYVSAKSGLNGLTRSAAGALGQSSVNVNAVIPGITATSAVTDRFGDNADAIAKVVREGPLRNLLGRMTLPEDVAELVAFLCGPGSRQITGQLVHVSGGAVV